MKKSGYIFLTVFYLLSSSGLVFSLHHCGEELKSIILLKFSEQDPCISHSSHSEHDSSKEDPGHAMHCHDVESMACCSENESSKSEKDQENSCCTPEMGNCCDEDLVVIQIDDVQKEGNKLQIQVEKDNTNKILQSNYLNKLENRDLKSERLVFSDSSPPLILYPKYLTHCSLTFYG